MENQSSKKGFGWGHLIIGILFIAAALFAFYDPNANLQAFAFIFAFVIILHGIFRLADSRGFALRIIFGIFDVLLGVFMLFNIYWTVLALPYLFAIWFIIDSLFRLLTLGFARLVGAGYFWFSLILNLLCIVAGVFLLFSPLVAGFTLSFLLGFYLMLVGIECIVVAFSQN